MDETPYLGIIRSLLAAPGGHERPPSLLYKYMHLFFIRYLVLFLFPGFLVLTVLWNIVRFSQEWSVYGANDPVFLFFVRSLNRILTRKRASVS